MIDEPEDCAAWDEAVKDVKPLPASKVVTKKSHSRKRPSEKMHTVVLRQYQHNLSLNTSADIDANTWRRFKREEFAVEGVLDLHGYTEEQAFEAVRHFVTQAYLKGKRCVLIVTGKGIRHQDEDIFAPRGILKERVPQWLNSEELRQMILTYIHPSAQLGGQGALYILLRRQRVQVGKL